MQTQVKFHGHCHFINAFTCLIGVSKFVFNICMVFTVVRNDSLEKMFKKISDHNCQSKTESFLSLQLKGVTNFQQ